MLADRKVKRIIGLDFETYWDTEYTLKKLTTTAYVRDKRFKAHCLSMQGFDQDQPAIYEDRHIAKAVAKVDWATTAVLCHHTHFDGLILTHHYKVIPAFYLCTLSMSRPLHGGDLPNDLETLSRFYGGRGKVEGYLSATGGIRDMFSKANRHIGERLAEGCARDVAEMWRIFMCMLPKYPHDELQLIHHTVRAYCEPILRVDIPRAKKAHEEEVARKKAILERVNLPDKDLRSRNKFAALLQQHGVEPPMKPSPTNPEKTTFAFAKADLDFQALQSHPDQRVRDLVEARLIVQSSLAETRPLRLIEHAKPALPVYLNYGKAHTLRWSGGDKVNLQNLSNAGELRGCIMPPPGHVLVKGDSSQIEARMVAAWAGQDDLVEAFRTGVDIYSIFAQENIYNYPINKKDNPTERTVGKVAVLGLGFQMWVDRFKYTLNAGIMTGGAGIYLEDESLYAKAVKGFRNKFPKIPELWRTMERAIECMYRGTPFEVGPIKFVKNAAILPNGMRLIYPKLTPNSVKTVKGSSMFGNKGETKEVYGEWTYNTDKKIYGGLLTENLVQSMARLVVAQQALRIADKFRIVLLVHDEIVLCVPRRRAELAEQALIEAMSSPPDWCGTLPTACETAIMERYGK